MRKGIAVRQSFNSLQVAKLTGATRKQVIHWDLKGVVRPSVQAATGRGSQRLYSYTDLLLTVVARELRRNGLGLKSIHRCLNLLRTNAPDLSHPLSKLALATDGQTVGLILPNRTVVDARRGSGELKMIDVAALDRGLRARLAAETSPNAGVYVSHEVDQAAAGMAQQESYVDA